MSIEWQAQSRCSCSFRSTTDYRSPINGLSEINRFELFYKHCIPTGFPDRLLCRLNAHIAIAFIDYLTPLLVWVQARDQAPRESRPIPFVTRRIVQWRRAQPSDRRSRSCSQDK